ncbi:unnamed protein product [Ostreobium quekettii]|uniref:Uncharacterized protein n=1 Tax=Ostreobium quekettii TaxID=121088 RepID=A0A8S1IT38_9CHLO|nr:unnamed protein product [Ostreobium quekettii]
MLAAQTPIPQRNGSLLSLVSQFNPEKVATAVGEGLHQHNTAAHCAIAGRRLSHQFARAPGARRTPNTWLWDDSRPVSRGRPPSQRPPPAHAAQRAPTKDRKDRRRAGAGQGQRWTEELGLEQIENDSKR